MSNDFEQAFQQYKSEYSLTVPPPKRGDYKARLPVQFWLFLPVAFLGPVVSGLRTATVFERASGTTGLAEWAPLAVAIMGTLVVELGVVGFQIERLRRLAEGRKTLPPASERWIIFGLVSAFGIALVANLDIVFLDALIEAGVDVPAWIEPFLVGLFLGAGVPFLALVAGEIVGRMIVEVQAANIKEGRRYQKALQSWRGGLKTSWDRVKKRRLAASGRPLATDKKASTIVASTSGHEDGNVVSTSKAAQATIGKASQAMADHLSAIKKVVDDQWQVGGGDGTFKRRDIETWRDISRSQAQNILNYGLERGLVEIAGRNGLSYKYRFVEGEGQ